MIRVDFRCENCGVPQNDVAIDYPEATVTCSDCEHTVDVGVYLGPELQAEIEAERARVLAEEDRRADEILRQESAANDIRE